MGHRGRPSLGRHLKRHRGRLPGGSSRNLPPPARGHQIRPPRPPSVPQLETPPHRHPPPPRPQSTPMDTWRRRHSHHHRTAKPREPGGIPHHLGRSGTPPPRLPHPPRCLRHHQCRAPGSESPPATGRRDAPGTITINHTRPTPHRAPHPPHHHNGAPPTTPQTETGFETCRGNGRSITAHSGGTKSHRASKPSASTRSQSPPPPGHYRRTATTSSSPSKAMPRSHPRKETP